MTGFPSPFRSLRYRHASLLNRFSVQMKTAEPKTRVSGKSIQLPHQQKYSEGELCVRMGVGGGPRCCVQKDHEGQSETSRKILTGK